VGVSVRLPPLSLLVFVSADVGCVVPDFFDLCFRLVFYAGPSKDGLPDKRSIAMALERHEAASRARAMCANSKTSRARLAALYPKM